MSEFYTMPIQTAKTNSSYVVPTSTNSSHHPKDKHKEDKEHSQNEGTSFGKKISRIFRRRGSH